MSKGFTLNTEVWHSAGFYRNFQEIMEKRSHFMTDSFNEVIVGFVVNKANVKKVGQVDEVVEVTFGGTLEQNKDKYTAVKCGKDQRFLTCYENTGKLHYKDNETFIWKKAVDLKPGMRLVAEDVNIEVKEVKIVNEEHELYTLETSKEDNYSIRIGTIVKC